MIRGAPHRDVLRQTSAAGDLRESEYLQVLCIHLFDLEDDVLHRLDDRMRDLLGFFESAERPLRIFAFNRGGDEFGFLVQPYMDLVDGEPLFSD